jgi:predicted component of type VI protein secretion system
VSHNPPPWYLTIRKGPKAGSAYPLPVGTITIGRYADNQIVIDDPMVSRHHARLTWQGNTFLLEDLESANGVWVNNKRITDPAPLRSRLPSAPATWSALAKRCCSFSATDPKPTQPWLTRPPARSQHRSPLCPLRRQRRLPPTRDGVGWPLAWEG